MINEIDAEKAWDNKLNRARKGEDVDFTAEELNFMLVNNENLYGIKADLSKQAKWNRLVEAANDLSKNKKFIISMQKVPPDRNKRHAVIAITLRPYTEFECENDPALFEMYSLADKVTFCALEEDNSNITLGFTILDVWSE